MKSSACPSGFGNRIKRFNTVEPKGIFLIFFCESCLSFSRWRPKSVYTVALWKTSFLRVNTNVVCKLFFSVFCVFFVPGQSLWQHHPHTSGTTDLGARSVYCVCLQLCLCLPCLDLCPWLRPPVCLLWCRGVESNGALSGNPPC